MEANNAKNRSICMAYCKLKTILRSSHLRCSVRKRVLRNFAKFTGKYLCQSLFFNKVAGLRLATLLKKRLWHRYFPVNFAKFLWTPFLQNICGRVLLNPAHELFEVELYSKSISPFSGCVFAKLSRNKGNVFLYVVNVKLRSILLCLIKGILSGKFL